MDGKRGYPRAQSGIYSSPGGSTFKEPPVSSWMERDRMERILRDAHGENAVRKSRTGLSVREVTLGANEYKEISVASKGSARFALARWAARLSPYATAFELGLYLGDWLFDSLNPAMQPYVIPGGAGYSYDIPADWTTMYTSADTGGDTFDLYVDMTGFMTSIGTYSVPMPADPQDSVGDASFDHSPYDGRAYSLADVVANRNNLYGMNPIGQLTRIQEKPGVTPGTLGDNVFSFSIRGFWQAGASSDLPTPQATAQTVIPGPEIKPEVPWRAIPHQDAWSNPFTSRGPKAMPRVSQEANPSAQGRTYVATVTSSGSASGESFVPVRVRTKPAEPGVKERKGVIGKGGAAGRIFGKLTEIGDFINCVFSAIPLRMRLKDGVTKRLPSKLKNSYSPSVTKRPPSGLVDVGLWQKALYIYRAADAIDLTKMVNCIVENEIEDRVIGKINQAANTQYVRHTVGGTGIGAGPAL